QQTTSDISGSSNKINTELPETRPNKVQKISQIEEDSVTKRTESEELSSQTSYNMGSPFHFSSQEQNVNHQVIAVDQSLKVSDVKILTNHVSKSNKTKLAARAPSWVWDHMKKDKSKKKIRCDVVITKLNGNEKKYDKIFSIATSTTHLGEHLNSVHRIFSYQQYGKNSDGQTIIDPDKSMPTIPSMFSKMEAHKPIKQQKLLYRLTAWIVDDCQALTVVEGRCF
ncbi:5841_t:CDS:1, partial [Racocetra persica]